MLLSGSSKGLSIEKFLSQNAHYEAKNFTELVTKYLVKFEKEIDGYFPSLRKNGFAYILSLQTLRCCRLGRYSRENINS